jgi:hypothetical protein
LLKYQVGAVVVEALKVVRLVLFGKAAAQVVVA